MPPLVPRKRLRTPSAEEHESVSYGRAAKSRKPTLFDAVDSGQDATRTLEDNQAYLEQRRADSDETSLSELGSSDFEDVDLPGSSRNGKPDQVEDDADEDVDWEDAIGAAPTSLDASHPRRHHHVPGDVEVTLDTAATYSFTNPHGKKKGPSKIERQIRMQTHCMHVQFLLFHNLVRNGWICDKEVQSILVKQLKPGMLKEVERWRAASGITKNAQEDIAPHKGSAMKPAKNRREKTRAGRDWAANAEKSEPGVPNMSRGDPLLRLLKNLAYYWKKRFEITAPGLRKQGYRSAPDLEAHIRSFHRDEHDPERHGERIRDVSEFRRLAKECRGSRDVGAQLFTALLRGLGLEARMVASLQPIGFGWSKAEEASTKAAKKNRENVAMSYRGLDDDGDEQLEESEADGNTPAQDEHAPSKANRQESKHGTRRGRQSNQTRRRSRSSQDLDNSSDDILDIGGDDQDDDNLSVVEVPPPGREKKTRTPFDRDLAFPIYWTEVLSPVTHRYIPVDPVVLNQVASTPELLASFEPRGAAAEKSKQVIAYVVGYSADGTAKDVTVRYLKRHTWPGKSKGVRMPVEKVPVYNRNGRIKKYEDLDWFKSVLSAYAREESKRTVADDLEEEHDLKPVTATRERKEGGETLQGYKNSAEFVLERHLRREEALRPGAKHVKTFATGKGEKRVEEKVYRRSDVLACKTVESWHKEGREVVRGEQPLKLVPVRAVTLTRKRELEQAEAEGGEKVKQGLYSRRQTDWIMPPPIEDGIIPRNGYGNIDCFVPSMVPAGAVHIRLRGTAKICRRLEISHAEAVVGFDFGAQRAVPVIEGVVVAAEHKQAVLDAWHADEAEKIRKEEGKQEKAILALWKKFSTGLRIKERVRHEYGGDPTLADEVNPFTNRNRTKQAAAGLSNRPEEVMRAGNGLVDDAHHCAGGGFLAEDAEDEANGGGGGFFPPVQVDDDTIHGGGFVLEENHDQTAAQREEDEHSDQSVQMLNGPPPKASRSRDDSHQKREGGLRRMRAVEVRNRVDVSVDRPARHARKSLWNEEHSDLEDQGTDDADDDDILKNELTSSPYWPGRQSDVHGGTQDQGRHEQATARRPRKAASKARQATRTQLQDLDADGDPNEAHDSADHLDVTPSRRRRKRKQHNR